MTRPLGLYLLAAALVVAYVNTFIVWQILRIQLGDAAAAVPWLLAALLAAAVAIAWVRQSHDLEEDGVYLVLAALCTVAGLLIADPGFPAKRVHVPQYAVLAAIVWLALPPTLDRKARVAACVVIGTLFGIHDEFLQGLHPDRTFGVRDMVVNLCGVGAGALTMAVLARRRAMATDRGMIPLPVAVAACAVATGLCLYVYAMVGLVARPLPYWAALPMLAGALALACAVARRGVGPLLRNVGTVIVLLLLLLAVYPVIANETPLHFA